ncbi:MAG: Gfo/Idh/MocA family oxidoreductase [Pseudomonadota bacterium]
MISHLHSSRWPKIAVVGCGYWGKNLVRNYAMLGVLEALVDHHQEHTDPLVAQFGAKVESFETVLNDDTIGAVVIATPGKTHFDLALAALEAGKDVFVEKPMTLSAASAEILAKKADEKKRILMVGHVLRYHAAFMKLEELARTGALGKIRHVISTRFNLGKILDDEDVIYALAPHDLSMVTALLGQQPEKITAQGNVFLREGIADAATLRLDYADNNSAEIRLSWMHPVKEHKLTVIGDKAMAVFDDTQPWDSKLTLFRPALNWNNPEVIPAAGTPEKITLEQSEPLRAECEHFLNACVTREQPLTNHQEGLAVMRILERAAESFLQNTSSQKQDNRRRATS